MVLMRLRQAIDGYLLFKTAEGLRPRTIALYRWELERFATWAEDPPLEDLGHEQVTAFLAYLRHDYRPVRSNGDTAPLSSQSVYNAWTALKSFARWVGETLDTPDMVAGKVPRPKTTNAEQTPFTVDEVRALLAAVRPTRAKRPRSGKRYHDGLRDHAIVLTLLDTGMRAGELCALTVGDVHLSTGQLSIHDGKGGKPRTVWLGDVTRPVVWRYLQERPDGADPMAPLFASTDGPMSVSWLRKRLVHLGQAAGVPDCKPHRFRYTFAIQYLRNGGDVFTLQSLLGHSSLTMVRYYLHLAQADVEQAHRRASPVDRWLK
jgi:integrase/recombinase XerD